MPQYPIYINMLPKEAQDVIGKPHEESAAALRILEKEGFHMEDTVDILDAGPSVQAYTANIRTVRRTTSYRIAKITEPKDGTPAVIANSSLDNFRVVRGTFNASDGRAQISAEVADALELEEGGDVLIASEVGK